MRDIATQFLRVARRRPWVAGVFLAAGLMLVGRVQAQNDNFADALQLVGDFGTVDVDSGTYTAEPGEPSHAGRPPGESAWFKWTASTDGLVQFDTYGSAFDTVLAVYTGSRVDQLHFVVANDDEGGTIGPSLVRFNAKRGQTYHVAVAPYSGRGGAVTLNWAYHSAGVFRFTSLEYFVSERDSVTVGSPDATTRWSVRGARVTVTRVAGSTGRVLVDLATEDGDAVEGQDYQAVTETLVFDDWELSKSVVIPIIYNGGEPCSPNRTFSVTLSNPRVDDLESTVIQPPRLDVEGSIATVTILDYNWDSNPDNTNDPPCVMNPRGLVNFERYTYRTVEDIGTVTIRVTRQRGGEAGRIAWAIDSDSYPGTNLRDNTFALNAGSDYATPDPPSAGWPTDLPADFYPANDPPAYGILSWGQGDNAPKEIQIPIYDDTTPEFNEDLVIRLYYIPGASDNCTIGEVGECTVTILYDDYPAGALDDAHNRDYDLLTEPPVNSAPGADATVYAAVVQPDGRTLIAGDFTQFNTADRNRIARLLFNGQNDTSFNPGSGADQLIAALALAGDGRIVIGGAFTSFNGVQRNGVARLNSNGSLDPTFNPGLGANDTVWAVAVYPVNSPHPGKVVIGGAFTMVNGYPRAHIARLNVDGSVDETFNPTNALNGTVHCLALAPDGTMVVGGEFTQAGAHLRNRIARLRDDGSVDTGFDPRTGVTGGIAAVYALALQPDGRILIGGTFDRVDLRPRRNLARLNPDGTIDESFDPGTGADDTVYTLTLQPDGRIILGGLFTSVNQTRRINLARLFADGRVDTSFMDTAYNHFAGFPKPYFNPYVNPNNFLLTTALQPDGNLIVGGSFNYIGGGRFHASIQTNLVENRRSTGTTYNRAAYRNRYNVARVLGGNTLGPGNIGLAFDQYAVDESMQYLFVRIIRTDGTLGHLEATFSLPPRETGPGVAEPTQDYIYNRINPAYPTSWANTRDLADGFYGTNNISQDVVGRDWSVSANNIFVTVPRRLGLEGDRYAAFQMDVPSCTEVFFLGGENIPLAGALGRTTAELKINDVDKEPGVLGFAHAAYLVNEDGTNAVITLIRTNGSFGRVTVRFATTNGTALHGVDYTGVTNTVVFQSGVTSAVVLVPIRNNSTIQNDDRTVLLSLSNPTGPAGAIPTLGLSNAVLYIVDDDFLPGRLNLSATAYVTNETAGAVRVTVTRTGGALGVLNVQLATQDGTALAGVNYQALSTTLQWDSGDSSPRVVDIPLLTDGLVTPNKNFSVRLVNPSVAGALGPRTNALVTLINNDFYGQVQFSAPTYVVNERAGVATLTVVRVGGSAETLSVNYATSNGTAVAGGVLPNYVATSGSLTFGPGVVARSFDVPILNDGVSNAAPFFFSVVLSGLTPAGATYGTPTVAQVRIVDAQGFNEPAGALDPSFSSPDPAGFNDDVFALALQPGGKIVAGGRFTSVNGLAQNRLARLLADGARDPGFMVNQAGANDAVRAVLSQTDTRIVVGGAFTVFNSVNRNGLVRLNYDGTLDTGFNPGAGADQPVYALAEAFVNGPRKLYVAGAFNTFNGVPSPRLVRLNDDGTVDRNFQVGVGANDVIFAVAVYPTNTLHAGKVLIGGSFTNIGGVTRHRIARLNPDGSVDLTFNPGTGANDVVRALAIQRDGKVLLGGAFTTVNGVALPRIARLNADGSVDGSFQVGEGCNDTVYGLAVQEDNRILVVGEFTRASGVSRGRITRLLANGAVDPDINFGSGANALIAALVIQPDGHLVIGGAFTEVQGQARNRIARLYGSALTGSGEIEFAAPQYAVDENGTNAVIQLRRRGGTRGIGPGGTNAVTVTFRTRDGTAQRGVNYLGVTNTVSFPVGEVAQTVVVPVLQDFLITPDLTVHLELTNVSPPAALGPQPIALLTVRNVDSGVRFASATYARNEDAIDGTATITLVREGSSRGTASVLFQTTLGGTAVPGVNYEPVTNLVTFLPGETVRTVRVPVLYNPLPEGDRTVFLRLIAPMNTLLFNPATAVLTIVDVDRAPGQLSLAAPAFVVGEADGQAVITVLRTNGRTGIVSVQFATEPQTAIAGLDYAATNGVLTFADGETVKGFTVPVFDRPGIEGARTLQVRLSNPAGGATLLPPTEATVTIRDKDLGLSFSSPAYVVNETEPAVFLSVLRLHATNLVTTVEFQTVDGTAQAGTNYVATSASLTFNPGETVKLLSIPILRDPRVTGNLSFGVQLTNATPGAQIVPPNPATVVIVDADPGIFLLTNAYSVFENVSNVVVTVIRSNANTGTVTVNYATRNDTATNGVDYVATGGVLVFAEGETLKTFAVPIIDNTRVEPDRTFHVELFNPTGGAQLLEPSTAAVTLRDNDAGLRFARGSFTGLENDVFATITVVRTNFTNSVVSVDYTTEDGSAVAGTDYFPASGTLTFTNGEVQKTFVVTVIDDNIVKGDRTVLLKLRNAVGDASIVNPGAATLTIIDNDGSLIVPAGVTLLSETNNNGVIDPGEPVTLLFGFRNRAGTNALNVTATLLATSGVAPVTISQNYGLLPVGGPAVSRPFSFIAQGTNGQVITATFRLNDGATDLGLGVFNFTLGTASRSFASPALITINDRPSGSGSAAATPYPSLLSVSGVDGVVQRITVTVSNFTHASASDVGLLLVSPTGQRAVLMANAGGFFSVSGITLTFDDAATNALPANVALTSGTYRPTVYPVVPPFPAPAPPLPYATDLGVFGGFNPNGAWSLYAIDDLPLFGGAISNGWSLAIVSAKPVEAWADLSLTLQAVPEPVIATSNLTCTVVVTNHGPGAAQAVVVSNTLPAGVALVATSASQGGATTNAAGQLVWTVGALARDAHATLTFVIRPRVAGELVLTSTASSDTFDSHSGNNSATVVSSVVTPTADLAVGMVDEPDPVTVRAVLKYTITIVNLGPAVATGVVLTNPRPAQVQFDSIRASQGTAGIHGSIAWASLGDLAAGQMATVSLRARPQVTGEILNSATASSAVLDPLKGNNTASAKTTVEPPFLTLMSPGEPDLVLERTFSLTPPVVWIPVLTNPPAVIQWPITNAMQYFRFRPLSWSAPAPPVGLTLTPSGLVLNHAAPPGTVLEQTLYMTPPVVWTPILTNPLPGLTLPVTNGAQFFRLRLPGL